MVHPVGWFRKNDDKAREVVRCMFLQCRHELGVSGLKFLTFYVYHLWIFPLCKKANSNNDEVGRKIMARFNNKYRHLRPAVGSFVEKTLRESIL